VRKFLSVTEKLISVGQLEFYMPGRFQQLLERDIGQRRFRIVYRATG
jgi:hypothetical protein